MEWSDLKYFLALSRSGSVRSAGSQLGVSHSTVARRVEALEERLKARLFDRTPEGYRLTAAGAQMVPGAERVEEEMAALERALDGKDDRLEGRVAVTCGDPSLTDLIVLDLARLCGDYPGIELEVTASYRSFDLSKREADIALRLFRPEKLPPEHLIGRRLVPIYYANYVAKSHAERLDPERSGSEARWLGWGERKADEKWVAATSYPELPIWGRFEAPELHLQALRSGLGVACLPCFAADRDPALVRLPQPDLAHYFDLWMLTHPDLRDNARLRAVREYLGAALLAHQELFEGKRPSSAPEHL